MRKLCSSQGIYHLEVPIKKKDFKGSNQKWLIVGISKPSKTSRSRGMKKISGSWKIQISSPESIVADDLQNPLTPTLSQKTRESKRLWNRFRGIFFLDQLHNFSLLTSNSFYPSIFGIKISEKIPWHQNYLIFEGQFS